MLHLPIWLQEFWPHALALLTLVLSVVCSVHILLTKNDSLAALAWMAMVWLVPMVGALLYWFLGVNRVKRRARLLRSTTHDVLVPPNKVSADSIAVLVKMPQGRHWQGLKSLLDSLTTWPLLHGNQLYCLVDGDQAYPTMLSAIDQAQYSVAISTYIFSCDHWGLRFADALALAVKRGVVVRVLIDGAGQYYGWPPVIRALRHRQIPAALFLHSFLPWRMPYLNLRNHRKIMVVDGIHGFTGGMNIRDKQAGNPPLARDLHFRVQGPVITQMMSVFVEDWAYATGEHLSGDIWFPALDACGEALARGIPDGPDEDYDKLRWALLAGLGQARKSVWIITPYFLPDAELQAALCHAAMRGVKVNIILPGENNWPVVQWAANAMLPRLLAAGCHVWLSAPPFDHSKCMVVDDTWCLLGSANWDPRSLRLNFEFNLEVYDPALAQTLVEFIQSRLPVARPLHLTDLTGRAVWLRLRDGLAHLLTPYL